MENKSEKELNVFIQNESISIDDNHIYIPDWKKDRKNIFLLIFLYFLQGVLFFFFIFRFLLNNFSNYN